MNNPCNPVCRFNCTCLCASKKRYLNELEDHDEDLILTSSNTRGFKKKRNVIVDTNKNGIRREFKR